MKFKKIILASQSPRRSQLLQWAEIPFEIIVAGTNESYPSHLQPFEVAMHIAENKAKEVKNKIISSDTIGEGLRISGRCPDDGIIEALEGTAPDHFVLAVQWHPERSVDQDEASRAIFRALIEASAK